MNKPNLANILQSTKTAFIKHSPEILTGIGIAGMISTTLLAVRATPRALKLIELKKKEECTDELTPIEVVKTAWKPYIPAAVTGVTSIACLIGASSVSTRRNAALATAYTLSETALKEYKDKVIETIGEKKERDIQEKIDKDHLDKTPLNKSDIIITKKGNTLCLDYHSGRYFNSDIDAIDRAINKVDRKVLVDGYASLNELYDELDLEHTDLGYDLGWNLDDGHIDVTYSAQLTKDNQPCIVMNYRVAPHRNFDSLAY